MSIDELFTVFTVREPVDRCENTSNEHYGYMFGQRCEKQKFNSEVLKLITDRSV